MRKLNSLTLPWPTDWTALFGAAHPLILEIGFGYGAFLLHLARVNPNANVIGIEIANKCLTTAEEKIERQHIQNVRIIHSTAETALHHLFQPASLSQVHINFPDPWFKQRHGHRRLMQRDTLDAIVNRLETGGLFFLATDIIEYAEMSAELLAETPGLDNLLDSPWANSMPGRVTTKYEGKALREGRACYYFKYRRSTLPPPDVPVKKELDMTHVVFQSPLTFDEMLERFEPAEHRSGDIVVNLIEAYRSKRNLLIEVFVKEPTIDQRVAFVVAERNVPGEYTLKLGALGHPRTTAGMHLATRLLGDWLVSLSPEARILKHKIRQDDEDDE
jgi:tRNA (guanine-N7-)-methyltransferase